MSETSPGRGELKLQTIHGWVLQSVVNPDEFVAVGPEGDVLDAYFPTIFPEPHHEDHILVGKFRNVQVRLVEED